MPRGTPRAGFRRTKKYWNEVAATQSLQDVEKNLAGKVPGIIAELEKLTKPIECPHCGNTLQVIDKDVGFYLVDKVMGRSKQKLELEVTETIQLDADQVGSLIEKHKDGFLVMVAERYLREFVAMNQQAIRPMLTEGDIIEGEVINAKE